MDFLDLRILEAIGAEGPRNLTTVARKLGINGSTLYARLKRLKPHIFLNVNVYHTFIGLRKVCLLVKAVQGKENLLFECMKAHDYWLYIFRYYAEFEGCFGVYAIPPEHKAEFEAFVEKLKHCDIAEKTEFFWSTCFQTVNPTTNWYDEESDRWDFRWSQWVQELGTQKTDLPYTLTDPEGFPQRADYTDIFILKELEKNAMTTLKSIAASLGTSLQAIKYHFDKHVVNRRLLESYQVNSFPFDREKSDFIVFILTFPSKGNLAKFANSLSDKPFAKTIGKVHGRLGLIAQLYLPRKEFRQFVDSLSTLINTGFLESYRYLIQDLRYLSRQTIPYKLFINEKWKYEHEKYLKEVSLLQNNESIPEEDSIPEIDTHTLSAKI